eukprot:TRINITY_DN25579_c0_g4_i2.p1 TRINITY_DN25579_c0_g4~~TRINITY_DN25579_c0_g4_i2.p1  ORF type:complete len:197 (-),score=45.09 TRINITY_DN25579_c0_g4_i2:162-752(-)
MAAMAMMIRPRVSEQPADRKRSIGRVVSLVALGAAVAQVCAYTFVPAPSPAVSASDSCGDVDLGPLDKAVQWGSQLQMQAEDAMYFAAEEAALALDEALEGDDNLADELVHVPISGAALPQKNLLETVLEPLTKLYMKYRFSIKPRCKDCVITSRGGRLWRKCKIRRHKARQPGNWDQSRPVVRKFKYVGPCNRKR